MKVLTRLYAFVILLMLVLAMPPNVLADCQVNLSASVSGTTLTASADAHSDIDHGIQLDIYADNFPVASKSCAEFTGDCHIAPVQTPTLCWKTGTHHVFGTATCYGEANSPQQKTYEFSVNTTPTVSATFEQDPAYPNQKRGWIRVDYSFPNTGAPTEGNESRAIAVSGTNYFYRSTWADLQSMSGAWRAPIDLTCFKTGTYTVQVQAVACQSADGEYRATTTTNVTVYTTPTVSVSLEQGATGAESAIVVNYQFPNTGARTISVYMEGNMEGRADEHTLAASGTWRIPLNTTCMSGVRHLLAQAVACNQSDESYKAEDQETVTIDSKPEVSVTAGGLDPDTNSYPITVDYNFKNTAGPGQRRINLYQNGLLIYAWTNLTDVSGSVTTITQGCGEVTAVAIACGNTNDPAYVDSATTQLPDDLCKADRTSCGMPGRPINWGSGDVSLTVPVFTIQQDPLPLSYDMTYHSSRPAYPSLAHEVASGWTNTFNQTLRIIDSTRVYGVDENGLERLYTAGDVVSTGGPIRFGPSQTWTSAIPADVHETVEQWGDQLLLRDLAGTVRTFDANSGRWQSTMDRWGNLIFASYDENDNLISVTDSAGRVITIVASGTTIQQITLPNGAVWKFQYSGGDLISIFDPLHTGATPWRTFSYQPSSRLLTAMRDDASALLEGHTYDAQGRGLTSFLENNREMVALEYDQPSPGQTRITHTIDATTSQLTIVTWQYLGGRYRATRIDGGCGSCGVISDTETRDYDEFGNLITITTADGNVTQQTFDENGQILSRTEAAGTALERTRTWEYGIDGWPDFVTRMTQPAPIGTLVTAFNWTGLPYAGPPRGVMTLPPTNSVLTTSVIGKLVAGGPDTTLTTTTTFDPRHRLLGTDGPRTDVADVTSISYFPDDDADINRRGRTASMTNALGMTVHYDSYDLYGTPTVMRDVNDVTTTTENDLRGRTTATTLQPVAGNSGESAAYRNFIQIDSRDRLTDSTTAGGNHVRYRYEDGTNLPLDTIVLDGSGNERERRHLTRNVIGSVIKDEAQSCGAPAATCSNWTTTRTESSVYDVHNRLTQIIHGDQSRKLLFYDAMGRIAQEQDETHDTPNTTYGFDLLGRRISVTRAVDSTTNAVTAYGYSLNGSLTSVTDPNGNVTHYEFDDFGRLAKTNSPVTGLITHVYDAAGNSVTDTAANGAVTQSVYDALNRLTGQTSAMNGSSESVSWTYDAGTFGLGRLTSMSDPSGSTSWTYERRGLVTGEQKTVGTATYATSYGYDANGKRTSIGYPSGRVVNYTFDYAARPYSVSSGATSIVASALYLPFGPLSQLVFGNGTTQTMTFDNRYQISENKLLSPAATIADYLYAHDASGDITQIHDATDSSYNRDFGYDGLHRLISANTGSSLWGTGTYHYDLMGNMTSLFLGASRNVTFNYIGTTPLLTSVTENGVSRSVTYDASGNEVNVGSGAFTYSPRNRLSAADGYTYVYDGRGLRTVATPAP